MSKVIICANQKGGVAKTTTTVNLGIGLAREGKKVLVIDNDPQGSLTEALGYQEPDSLEITLAQIMDWVLNEEPFDITAGILHHEEGIDLMPANIELSGVETSLVGIMSSETVLKEYIDMLGNKYDYIIVDCSPNLGQLTLNALVAADEIIIPVQAAYLPIKGLEQLLKTISRVKRKMNPKLHIMGILLTMVDYRTNYANEITEVLYQVYGSSIHIFENVIPMSVRAAETPAEGVSIYKHDAKGKVAIAYEERQELTVKDIKAALDFLDGRMSIDQMMEEDGIEGEAFEDKNNEGPELKNEVMDINVQKLFDLFLDRMSDIEKFFALIEIGCSEKYASMTVSQFSVDPVFINIVEADSRYAKNIKMGDVVIKRPDRHSYTDRDIELKDVKFVGGTVVRYQREQTRFRWAKLKEVISEDDILGNKSVEYFQEKWDELLNKYNY